MNVHEISSVQVPPVKIAFSDKPELVPLTVTHLLGPLLLLALILLLAIFVWMTELCIGFVQQKKQNLVSKFIHPMEDLTRDE